MRGMLQDMPYPGSPASGLPIQKTPTRLALDLRNSSTETHLSLPTVDAYSCISWAKKVGTTTEGCPSDIQRLMAAPVRLSG